MPRPTLSIADGYEHMDVLCPSPTGTFNPCCHNSTELENIYDALKGGFCKEGKKNIGGGKKTKVCSDIKLSKRPYTYTQIMLYKEIAKLGCDNITPIEELHDESYPYENMFDWTDASTVLTKDTDFDNVV